jgi:hypothetical protein
VLVLCYILVVGIVVISLNRCGVIDIDFRRCGVFVACNHPGINAARKVDNCEDVPILGEFGMHNSPSILTYVPIKGRVPWIFARQSLQAL